MYDLKNWNEKKVLKTREQARIRDKEMDSCIGLPTAQYWLCSLSSRSSSSKIAPTVGLSWSKSGLLLFVVER